MKQLLFLFLFIVPCLAWAQYPTNGNQKITLGEQTTADGLIFRGVLADTGIITPLSDTSAYIILDTVNHRFYNYNRATNVWSVAGGGTSVTTFSGGTTGLTPNTATSGAVTLAGTLAVANGGTNALTFTAANRIIYSSSATQLTNSADFTISNTGDKYFEVKSSEDNKVAYYKATNNTPKSFEYGVWGTTSGSFGAIIADDGYLFGTTNMSFVTQNNSGNIKFGIGSSGTERMRLSGSDGELKIGYSTTDNGAYPLQVNGQIFATSALIATSDIKFKENITPLKKGLEIVNKLKPVTFNFINDTENNFSEYEEVGFIAQDVDRALSTETFSKSIVKSADDSDPNSTMGLSTGNLIPILVKAIQEQQAQIKALELRIFNLENK
jgi:hypothetical protein